MQPAALARVKPDGSVDVAADGLEFPNGTVITPDGRTLIVGESMGQARNRVRDRRRDGTLRDRRLWAELGEVIPDGCTLDAEGAIWFADARGTAVVRVREGGEVTDRIEAGQHTFACALGGDDGRTLFVVCADSFGEAEEGAAHRHHPHRAGRRPPRRPAVGHPLSQRWRSGSAVKRIATSWRVARELLARVRR